MRILFLIATLLLSGIVRAADSAPDTIRATCVACHGDKGVSNNPLWPDLASQKKEYLIKQLQDFRSGFRRDPIMEPISRTLTDKDVAALAEFYSAQTK